MRTLRIQREEQKPRNPTSLKEERKLQKELQPKPGDFVQITMNDGGVIIGIFQTQARAKPLGCTVIDMDGCPEEVNGSYVMRRKVLGHVTENSN